MLEYTNSTFHRVQVTRAYTSSMLQTFNKFCFSHGLVELSAKLPGRAEQPGIWPAFWIFGNLGRAILKDSTDQLWPFSYDQCPDLKHAAANQAPQDAQRINACLSKDITDLYGLNARQGRGAVEIDIIEAMQRDL
ncbi:KRE6 [Symbiodinium pilosum]|uniref:KRE6 protein n=1 Tax=Symbiodinium pilosum TaxID=2952 RepID=A0A812Q943_SYMPI|nr:KRE6 [Symbiodinium pilosum]